MLQIELEV